MNRKFAALIFDIFGYSFVGVLAYLFGLVLQNYNVGNGLIKALVDFDHNARDIVMAMLIQVLLIFLFGHAYATAFLINSESYPIENGVNVCGTVGHWLETIFIGIVTFIIIDCILGLEILSWGFRILFVVITISYVFSSFLYRSYKSKKDSKQSPRARHSLVYPTLLMICFNIYVGANILSLLKGEGVYYIPIGVILVFLTWLWFVKDKDIAILSTFSIIVIIVSGLMAILKIVPADLQLAMKNFFLAIMVSVFLSIFESWYITIRQMKNADKRVYMRVSMITVALMPPLVFILYPIQQFNFCYCLTFWLGMLITDYFAFYVILPITNREKKLDDKQARRIAIVRALLGVFTLIFLIGDKYITYMPNWENTESYINIFFSAITIAVMLTEIIINFKNFKSEDEGKTFKKWVEGHKGKWGEYMMIRYVASFAAILWRVLFYGFINVDEIKAKLSSAFFCLFIFLTAFISVYKWYTNKNINDEKANP